MKWPNTITILRHGESAFNLNKKKTRASKRYNKFKELFEKEFEVAKNHDWPSEKLKEIAIEVWDKNRLDFNDYEIPLTDTGFKQTKSTAKKLKALIEKPDIIYFSPYLRTKQTLEGLIDGWSALADVRAVPEERIREQEHGVQTVFNDWRIFCTLNPIQGLLFKKDKDYFYRQLNGENKADVRDRLRSFLGNLIREDSGKNVLLISHHVTLLCIMANLERWLPEKYTAVDESEKPINCGVTIYKGDPTLGRDGRLVLDTYNKKLY